MSANTARQYWPLVNENGHRRLAFEDVIDMRETFGTLDSLRRLLPDKTEDELWSAHARARTFACANCDEYPALRFDRDTQTVAVVEPCAYPDGVSITTRLAVPSGRMVVADDLRPIYDAELPRLPGYNSALGQKAYAEALAKIGCAQGFVSNTSPSIFRSGADSFVIATFDDDTLDGEPIGAPGERVADICTDVWSYAVADHDDFIARGGDLERVDGVIAVTPGVYEFVTHTAKATFDFDGEWPLIYAEFRLVQPAVSLLTRGARP